MGINGNQWGYVIEVCMIPSGKHTKSCGKSTHFPMGKSTWLFDIANWKPWPIEIDGLPFLTMVIFKKKLCNKLPEGIR